MELLHIRARRQIDPAPALKVVFFLAGALPSPPQRRERRGAVTPTRSDGTVRYGEFAFSRPNDSKLNYPLARTVHKRFDQDALAAMQRAVFSD